MKFSASTLALFVSAAMAMAVPEAAPVGMVARDVSGNTLFGRSFPCASNDPTTCCACRGGYGTCINGQCSCNGGDC